MKDLINRMKCNVLTDTCTEHVYASRKDARVKHTYMEPYKCSTLNSHNTSPVNLENRGYKADFSILVPLKPSGYFGPNSSPVGCCVLQYICFCFGRAWATTGSVSTDRG